MALYQETSNSNLLEVRFGPGKSITLKVRPDAVNVNSARIVNHQIAQAERIQKRIEQLGKQADNPDTSIEEFDRLTKEIEELQSRPDNISVMVNHIMSCVSGWTDYYPTPEIEAAGGPVVEFSRATVEMIHPANLGKIIEALNRYYGLTEEAEVGESKGATSPAPLPKTASPLSDTQSSISN